MSDWDDYSDDSENEEELAEQQRIQDEINKPKQVKCSFPGCTWTGDYFCLETHEKGCIFGNKDFIKAKKDAEDEKESLDREYKKLQSILNKQKQIYEGLKQVMREKRLQRIFQKKKVLGMGKNMTFLDAVQEFDKMDMKPKQTNGVDWSETHNLLVLSPSQEGAMQFIESIMLHAQNKRMGVSHGKWYGQYFCGPWTYQKETYRFFCGPPLPNQQQDYKKFNWRMKSVLIGKPETALVQQNMNFESRLLSAPTQLENAIDLVVLYFEVTELDTRNEIEEMALVTRWMTTLLQDMKMMPPLIVYNNRVGYSWFGDELLQEIGKGYKLSLPVQMDIEKEYGKPSRDKVIDRILRKLNGKWKE